MAYPTPQEIDAAVPVNGEPSRALTNAALKGMVAAVSYIPADGTIPQRSTENENFSGGRIKASSATDPDDCVILVQMQSELASGLAGRVSVSEKGMNSGVAPLDASGIVPIQHLNISGLSFLGGWNPSTNTPPLLDGSGTVGSFYKASANGTHNFGNGDYTFAIGDWVMYAGGTWQRIGVHEAVASVNGKTGVIALNAADVGALPTSYTPPASTWASITGKPGTFQPVIGTTSTTAKAGDYQPTWAQVTGKPTTFAPIVGTTSTTAKAGDYQPAWAQVTGKPDLAALYAPKARGTLGYAIPGVHGFRSSVQSIPNNVVTDIVWTTASNDSFSMFQGGVFIIPSWATHAKVTATIDMATNATGYRYAAVKRGTTNITANRSLAIATTTTTVLVTTHIFSVTAGDAITASIWQDSGGPLNLSASSSIQIELYSSN